MELKFDKVSKNDWLVKVEKDLKGKPIDVLNWQSGNRTYTPFFHNDDAIESGDLSQKSNNSWQIGIRIYVTDATVANTQILDVLNKGANCITLVLSSEAIDFKVLFKDVQLEWIATHFQLVEGKISQTFVDAFEAYIASTTFDSVNVECSFDVAENVTITKERKYLIASSVEDIDQSLAELLHKVNQSIESIANGSIPVVRFSLTDIFYENIAKLRAFKLIANQLFEAYGISATLFLEAVVNEKTFVEDENTNKIKSGAQAMSAIAAGVDRLTIYPSDELNTEGGTIFSRRIALNIHHLMEMESYMGNVVDPAAGSYLLEKMTNDLAESAWNIFKNEYAQ